MGVLGEGFWKRKFSFFVPVVVKLGLVKIVEMCRSVPCVIKPREFHLFRFEFSRPLFLHVHKGIFFYGPNH